MSETAAAEPRQSVAGFPPGAAGITAPSNPDRQGAFLTDVIAELGFADNDTVERAVEATRNSASTPERYLLDSGAIDEQQLSLALAERNGLDHVDLDRFAVDPEAVGMVGKSTAARYTALPIAFAADGALLVAVEDPHDVLGTSDIEVMTRNEVRPVIATGTQIRRLIESLPEQPPTPAPEWPEPPEPVPEPEPEPVPEPEPDPEPEPEPEPVPEPEPAPEPEPVAPGPDLLPHQPDPPVAAPLASGPERNGPEPRGDDDVEAEIGELSAALETLQGGMRHAGTLVEAVERERRRSAERERELEDQLTATQERLAALEERLSNTTAAVELANAATDKLAELRTILEDNRPEADG